jgi:hypothetical protein
MDDGKYGKNVTTSQNWKKKTHTHTQSLATNINSIGKPEVLDLL